MDTTEKVISILVMVLMAGQYVMLSSLGRQAQESCISTQIQQLPIDMKSPQLGDRLFLTWKDIQLEFKLVHIDSIKATNKAK